ncbi:FAD-binding protein, partial [Sutterella massiliensis]
MTTRRSFLKAGLFTTVAGMSAAASAVPLKTPKKWDEEFDFVVIGAGAAGLVAAGHAAEAGLKVLV